MFIDFLGIGVQRSGSTWLHNNLGAQPDIWLPPLKEIHYFDRDLPMLEGKSRLARNSSRWARQMRARSISQLKSPSWDTFKWDVKYFLGRRNLNWYQSLFPGDDEIFKGEITPAYSILPADMVQRIHEVLPNLRVLLVLRNPIERAWSHAIMDLAKKRRRKMSSVTEGEIFAHIHSPESRLRGDYPTIVSNWNVFRDKGQLGIFFYENLVENPKLFISEIVSFIRQQPLSQVSFSETRFNQSNSGTNNIPDRIRKELEQIYLPDIDKFISQGLSGAANWKN